MVERKTKRTDKEQKKTSKSTKKEEKPTKTTVKKTVKKVAEKQEKKAIATKKQASFEQRRIAKKTEEKIPSWLIILFSFSLAFLLFAIYKTFVYGQGYNFKQNNITEEYNVSFDTEEIEDNYLTEDNYVIENDYVESEYTPEDPSEWAPENNTIPEEEVVEEVVEEIVENKVVNEDEITNDIQLIQDFYSYLINDNVDEMNSLVDTPLKNSSTWSTHWSKKNIWIFTKHLNEDVSLENISFIEGSENIQKHTRKYEYTFKYSIDTNVSFTENWEATLLTRDWKTVIAEIMCKTEGCSRSPFFWPQNYWLK